MQKRGFDTGLNTGLYFPKAFRIRPFKSHEVFYPINFYGNIMSGTYFFHFSNCELLKFFSL